MLIAFNCHNTHGGNGFRNTFWETPEAALLLEGDFDIGVVGDEAVLLPHVRLVPG